MESVFFFTESDVQKSGCFITQLLIFIQSGREVTVHPDNTHPRLSISLHCTAQHAVQYKMVGWQQCAR
jgi:hypothetical protein